MKNLLFYANTLLKYGYLRYDRISLTRIRIMKAAQEMMTACPGILGDWEKPIIYKVEYVRYLLESIDEIIPDILELIQLLK